MLDQSLSVRCAAMWGAWLLTALVFAADWALWDAPKLGELSIILIAIAATLTILNDNARTRSLAWLAMHEDDPEQRVSRLH